MVSTRKSMAVASRQPYPLSRPLCPWPQYARYLGQGDPNAATSFVCTAP